MTNSPQTPDLTIAQMRGCTAEAALEEFTRQMKRLPAVLRKSMTNDRCSEMACHPELARRLKIDIWFCDPYAPRPRGSNEYTNGLLAPVLPQGHRPERHHPDRTQRRRPPYEPATPQDPRMENSRRSHGQRTRSLQIKRCT